MRWKGRCRRRHVEMEGGGPEISRDGDWGGASEPDDVVGVILRFE